MVGSRSCGKYWLGGLCVCECLLLMVRSDCGFFIVVAAELLLLVMGLIGHHTTSSASTESIAEAQWGERERPTN